MKVESIQAAKAAYDIEAQCILEMKDYFDEVAFARAVHLLAQAPRIGAAGCGHSASSVSTLRTSCAASSARRGSSPRLKPSTARQAFCRRAT